MMLTRRLVCVFITLSVFCSKPAMASWLDLFWGISPPLAEPFDASRQGVAIDVEFRVKKKCIYRLNIEFLHKNNQWNELTELIGRGKAKKGTILPVHLKIMKKNLQVNELAFDELVETYGSSAHSSSSTVRTIGYATLTPGTYQATLKMLQDTPAITGINANFVVEVRPKATCE